ncbi:MAG: hypothetical protein AUH33_05515 [Chloroflexi bacterium 13_1_40CM_68_21]|nr:MAG: hypothetical protein AUH33_05515 [Chloroflexi bacterium 13_1_40CM_68_21]
MQVSQVAYDRFRLELPPADATWRPLGDPETLAETAAWLWDFGPTPLIAVVGYDGAAPSWLAAWSPRPVRLAPGGASTGVAVVLATRKDLERFLSEGAPHERTVLLWPRTMETKTFEALSGPPNAWIKTVDADANIQRGGEVFEVHQIQVP